MTLVPTESALTSTTHPQVPVWCNWDNVMRTLCTDDKVVKISRSASPMIDRRPCNSRQWYGVWASGNRVSPNDKLPCEHHSPLSQLIVVFGHRADTALFLRCSNEAEGTDLLFDSADRHVEISRASQKTYVVI
jgi:hypothetical protein